MTQRLLSRGQALRSVRRAVCACVLAAFLTASLAACGGDGAEAHPAADSPYAQAHTVILVCGLGKDKPGKGWLIGRGGAAADGEMATTGADAFRENYRYTASQAAVDGLFDALWQARFLDVPAGNAGDYG